MHKTYCSYPFTQIATKLFRKGSLETFWPCCNMGNVGVGTDMDILGVGDVKGLTPDELFNHPRMKELRENLKNGIRDNSCRVCWDLEDKGLDSPRQFSVENWDNITYEEDFHMLDITISNICNLRCRMCSPGNSNALQIDAKEIEKLGKKQEFTDAVGERWTDSIPVSAEKSIIWTWITNLNKIKVLKMSGGEPFYDKHVRDLLSIYAEKDFAKDIILEFHTNGTQFTDELAEILKKFKENYHTISIDGAGKVYDYIRYPGTFEQTNKSIKNYIKNVHNDNNLLRFNFVLTSMNILNVPEFIDWAGTLGVEVSLEFSPVNPSTRGIAIDKMPVHLLKLARDKIYPYMDMCNENKNLDVNVEKVQNIINTIDSAIKNNKENKQKMFTEITILDSARKQSYKDYLDKELVEWLDD